MLVKVRLEDGSCLYRNVLSNNIRKMAKSIHAQFPTTDYPSLEGVIFNAYVKGLSVLEIKPPVAQVAEQAPYKG